MKLPNAVKSKLITVTKIIPAGITATIASMASIALFLNLLGQILGFVQQVFFARILGVREFGTYTYVFNWSLLFAFIVTAGLGTSLSYFLPSALESKNWGVARSILRWSIRFSIIGSLFGALTLGFGLTLLEKKMGADIFPSIILGCFLVPLIAYVTTAQSILISLRRVALGLLLEPISRVFLVIGILGYFVLRDGSLMSVDALWLTIGTYATSVILLSLFVRVSLPIQLHSTTPASMQRSWLFGSSQLFLISLLQFLLRSIDLFIVGFLCGLEPAGLYAVATRLAEVATFPLNSVNTVVCPIFAGLYSSQKYQELRINARSAHFTILLLTLPILIVLVIGGQYILALFGEDFSQAFHILLILLMGSAVSCLAGPVYAILAMTEQYRAILMSLFVAIVVSVSLNLFLVPRWGATGAAAATVASMISLNFLLGFHVWRRFGIKPIGWQMPG